MGERSVSATEARRTSDEVPKTAATGEDVVVERYGEPVAVVISMSSYRQWQQSLEHGERTPAVARDLDADS